MEDRNLFRGVAVPKTLTGCTIVRRGIEPVRQLLIGSLLAAFGLCSPSRSGELNIRLTLRDTEGSGRHRGYVSCGVPLLPGQCQDANHLQVYTLQQDPKTGELKKVFVTAQFRTLASRWRKDNSVRWVLVDLADRLRPFETKVFYLTDGRRTEYRSPLKVKETEDLITVSTGIARFVINRKRFNLFERVFIDLDGDGSYSEQEEVVSPDPTNGSVVEDTFGRKYYSSAGTRQVEVEEAGPVRVCVVARGVHHVPAGEEGFSRGMYGFDIRMHFQANTGLVRIDAVLNNSLPKPIGSPSIEDHSLVTRLNLEPSVNPNPEAENKRPIALYRIYGQAPLDGEMSEGESAVLYQDSNGSETWKVNPGVTNQEVSSFRGYRIIRRGPGEGREEILTGGDHARGVYHLSGKKCGIVFVPRYFWQLFPKAVEGGWDGRLRVSIFPREYKKVHWLPDAGGAGMVFWLHFYGRGLQPPAVGQYPRDYQTKSNWWALFRDRPWPHVIADSLIPGPPALLCSKEHYAACGALADIGPYLPIRKAAGFPLPMTERRYFMTDYLKGNAYGWPVFGSRWEEFKGHSPYNYEPIGSSDFLYRFINSQHPTWHEFGYRRSMQYRNVRAYKIDNTRPFSHTTWGSFRSNNVCEDYCGRAAPKDEEVKKYSQGKYRRAEWVLANPAHMNLDEVLDLYCLFGDVRALECSRNAAAVGGAYVAFQKPAKIHRATGWCMRTLMRYYDLTGSDECEPFVKGALDSFWMEARTHRSESHIPYKNTWFYNVYGRAAIMAYVATGDERMRDWAIGLTSGRTKSKSQHSSLLAFAYDQTGREKYLSRVPDRYARLGGYFPACDGYLWAKPRPDKTPPAAVKDLLAAALGGGAVKLTWSAPGDDGKEGAAAVYQVKYDDLPLVELAKAAGQCSFWAAQNVSDEPEPRSAGSRESFTVKGLTPGRYHFALKSRDEYNNESSMSNVVQVEVN